MNNNQNNGQNVILPDNLNPVNSTIQPNNYPPQANNNITNTEFNGFDASVPEPQNAQMQGPEASINSMNIKDNYNNLDKPGYVNEAQVRENIENHNKKNTIVITKELKTVIVITLVLLVFIIFMPMLFDLISNLRFN